MHVRLASVAMQRWMSSIVAMIVTFSAIRMVYWLSHSPTWCVLEFQPTDPFNVYLSTRYGVYMFISPVLLLPLLASSYAEVNYEGVRVIQVIFRFAKPTTHLHFFIPEHSAHREEGPYVPIPVWPSHPDDSIRTRHFLWNHWHSCSRNIGCFCIQNIAAGNWSFLKPK